MMISAKALNLYVRTAPHVQEMRTGDFSEVCMANQQPNQTGDCKDLMMVCSASEGTNTPKADELPAPQAKAQFPNGPARTSRFIPRQGHDPCK